MRIGSVGETELRLHPLLFPVLAAACVLGRLNELLQALLAIGLHEAGHAVVSYAFGVRVYALELMPFGAVARVDRRGTQGQAELCIAAAGPLVSLLSAGLTAMCADLLPQTAPHTAAFLTFNLVLAAVNLLPALPLDGGRMARALLRRRLTLHAATVLCSVLGVVFGAGLLGLTVYCAAQNLYNLTFPTMGLFLLIAAIRELRQLPETEVQAYFHRFDSLKNGAGCRVCYLAAHESMPAAEAVRILQRDRFNVLRVVDAQMQLLGELDEGSLLRGIAMHGADRSLGELLETTRPE